MKLLRIIFSVLFASVLLNACQKDYSVENGLKAITTGTWQFTNGSTKYSGNMDTVYQTTAGSTNELFLIGTTTNGSQSFEMHLFADSFKVGTYKASAFQSSFTYSSTGKTIYQASQLIGEFVVNITSINNNNITGTFSGSALDSTNNLVQLTAGSFKSTFANGIINPSSSGVLGDSSGNCKPVIISGTYALGIPTSPSNTVQVQVTVVVPGVYTISTNTVNGISFSGTGTFSSVGPQNVLLFASGTPTKSGSTIFTLQYGNSQCAFTLNILGNSTGTLGSTAGSCTSFTFTGTYQQGIVFNIGNTVTIQVNVTTPGAYNISSNLVNGVSFSGSGIFTNTGVQNVILTGTGTPQNPGLQDFSITYGTSTCGFPIIFLPPVGASNDYFPLSLNSNWPYSLVGGTTSDSLSRAVINYSPTISAETYQTITQNTVPPSGVIDSFYYRKDGLGNYYEYVDFRKILGFDNSTGSEFIFLKDNIGSTGTWTTPNITGTIGGVPISGYVQMTILGKGPVTINPYNFPDVIKVEYDYYITGNPTPALTQQRWFAKNVGEIYFSSNFGGVNTVYQVGNYQIF